VILCLGSFALDGVAQLLRLKPRPRFGHAAEITVADGRTILCSFHPSQQNTFTGKLTQPMFDAISSRARHLVSAGPAPATVRAPGPSGPPGCSSSDDASV